MVLKLFQKKRLETTPVKVIQSISTDESTQADSAAKSVLDDLLPMGYNPNNGGDLTLMESKSDDSSDRYALALTGSVDEQEQGDLPHDLSRDSSYYMGANERDSDTTVEQEDMPVWSKSKQHIEIMRERSDDRVLLSLAKASGQERYRPNLHVKPNIFKTGTDENHILSPVSPSSMFSFFQRLKPTSPTNNDRADPPGSFLDKYSLIDETESLFDKTESCEASLKKIQIHGKQQGDISVISMDAAIMNKLRWKEDDGAVDSATSLSTASETTASETNTGSYTTNTGSYTTNTGTYTNSTRGSSNSSKSGASRSTKSPSMKLLEKTSCDSQGSSSKKGHSESSVVFTDKEPKGRNTMWDWNHTPFSSTFLSKEVKSQTSKNELGATTSAVTGPVPVDAPSPNDVKQPSSLSNQEMPLSGARYVAGNDEKPSISKDNSVQTENNDKRSAPTASKSPSRLRKGLKSLFRKKKKNNCVEGVVEEEPLPELPIDVSGSNSEERMAEELYGFMPIALMSLLNSENDPSFDWSNSISTGESTTEQSSLGKSILSESTKGTMQSRKINFVELSPSFIGDIKTVKGEQKQKKLGGLMKRFKEKGNDCKHVQQEIPRNTHMEVPRITQHEIDEMAETEILEKVEEGVELIAGLTKRGKKAIVISNTKSHPQCLYEC
jgi:hypothetical protein